MKQPSIVINESIINYFLNSSWGRYSHLEALAYLIKSVSVSPDQRLHTSINLLAKTWHWDNHTTEGFITDLIHDGIIDLERGPKPVCIKLRSEVKETLEQHPYLASLLRPYKKISKSEAFFYLASVMMHKCRNPADFPSYRSIGQDLGWNHHSVKSLLDILQSNNCRVVDAGGDSTDSSTIQQ